MKGVNRCNPLLFAVGKSVTLKLVITEVLCKAVVGPEFTMLINFRKRFSYVN